MTAPDDRLEPGTPEWEEEKQRRRGRPSGEHIKHRHREDDVPRQAGDYVTTGDVKSLFDLWQGFQMEAGRGNDGPLAQQPRSKLHLTLNIPTMLAIVGMVVAGFTALNNFDARLSRTEIGVQDSKDRATKYVPVIEALREAMQAQKDENAMQNDRQKAFAESIADERRARQAGEELSRKANADVMVILDKVADKLAALDKTVAVMGAGGRRSDISPPVRDAQVMQGR